MSSDYRTPTTPGGPLFVLQRPFLRAIDAKTGGFLWEHKFDKPDGVGRMFLQEGRVLVAMGPELHCFEARSGRTLGIVALGFTPDSGLLHEGKLILADTSSVACISADGRILWIATGAGGWETDIVCRDEQGNTLWKAPSPSTDARSAAGLGIDGIVVQPDKGRGSF